MDNELAKLRIDKQHRAPRQAERSRAPIFVLMVAMLVLVVVVIYWQKASTALPVKTMRVRVAETNAANDGQLVLLNATGYIIAAHKIELASKVSGRVAWIGVEMGDKIAPGQTLVRLEDDEFKARLLEQQGRLEAAKARLAEFEAGSRPQEIAVAAAAVEKAKAELAAAESNYRRVRDLESGRSVSPQQVDDALALSRAKAADVDSMEQQYEMAKEGPRKEAIDAQRANVRQLEGSLAQAQVDLNNTQITAPVAATVLARNVEVGEFVTTGFVGDRGAKGYVVSIADLNDLRVELDISQNDFAKVSAKQPCWIVTDAYPDRKYAGEVDLISPEANRQKATIQVRVRVLQPDELLRPDMNATVSFLSAARLAASQPTSTPARSSVRIPKSAFREGNVYVIENNIAVARRLTLGLSDASGNVEVKDGLIGGEDLILDPPAALKAGDAVKVQE